MSGNEVQASVVALLESNLGLPAGSIRMQPGTPLLGAVPELDSMSLVTFLISLEEQYGIVIHDDEVDARVFATVGNLVTFVNDRIN